jgi:small subunit ribosomal protein S14
MAKTSVITRNEKRKRLAAKYQARREELLKIARDRSKSIAEVFAANQALALLPRNSAPTRIRNRCLLTGRGRAYSRKFGLSRTAFRALGSQGLIPGLTKASW